MKRILVLGFIIIASNILVLSQSKKSSISYIQGSIYEVGDSLTTCETNLDNLYRNWHNGNITNAKQYELDKYTLVETISDSARYRYYRNYFSGLEVVRHYYAGSGSSYSDGKQLHYKNEYFIAPYKEKWALLEQLPIETMVKMLKLYNTELNIDTIKLIPVIQKSIQITDKKQDGNHFNDREIMEAIWAYSDSVTKKCIDSMVFYQKRFQDLSLQSQETVLLAQALLMRVETQKRFNEVVHIGDKVYVVPFRFGGYNYKVYIICNPISKKVVLDSFFKNIRINSSR